jgi:hypothetical protein
MATSSNSAPEDTEQVLAVCAEENRRSITGQEGTDFRSQRAFVLQLGILN